MFAFRDGDVLLTYGSGGLWPPRRLVLWLVYRGIRAYQKAKWGEMSDYRPTHVRVWVGKRFFEMTIPVGQWTDLPALALDKKGWKVSRCRMSALLDVARMEEAAGEMVGREYDKGDLLDFALAGLAGFFARTFRIFGDRQHKYQVCSTAVAKVLSAGGVRMRITRADIHPDAAIADELDGEESVLTDEVIDPAYFVNNPSHWEVVSLRL